MPPSSDARQKMIRSAALLFRERGVEGTSFSDVIAHSGAPRGSIYHHFRGGKTQLAEEATRWAGEVISQRTSAALAQHDPTAAVAGFIGQWESQLRATNYTAGCTIVAAALEGEREPSVRDAAAEAFTAWQHRLARDLEAHVAPERARTLSVLVVAAIEGAIVLARAQRSTQPLADVSNELQALLAAAIAADDRAI